jgi:DDE superfamily endonuclease
MQSDSSQGVKELFAQGRAHLFQNTKIDKQTHSITKMTPQKSSKRRKSQEYDTIRRVRFFNAFDAKEKDVSFNDLCKNPEINIPPSTARTWLNLRAKLGSSALRRTRKLSTRLGRPNTIPDGRVKPLFDKEHPSHFEPYESIVRRENFSITPRSLQAAVSRRFNARRTKRPRTKPISKNNKIKRTNYGEEHQKKSIRRFWSRVSFTDESHFNSKDLSNRTGYELRQPGVQPPTIQETDQIQLDITLHVAASVSYNHKGIFLFYNDPDDKPKLRKPRGPRRSKYESEEQFQQRKCDFEASLGHPLKPQDIPPKGNSMTQKFYAKEVLPKHIKHTKWLEAKYKRKFYLQEDNDPSHGTRSKKNLPRQLKEASHIQILIHPAQSPDLNPIEGIWNIIKQRLRGGRWETVEEFKEAILAEWRKITLSEIRRRISEMPKRCAHMVNTNGERFKSDLW